MFERRMLLASPRERPTGQGLYKSHRDRKYTSVIDTLDINTESPEPLLQTLVRDRLIELSDSEPLKSAMNSLMITKAKIAGISARVPIDSGTKAYHIPLRFCKSNQLSPKAKSQRRQ